jgi:hypothetical protein
MVRFFMRRGSRETAAEPFPHPSLSKPRLLGFGMAGGGGDRTSAAKLCRAKGNVELGRRERVRSMRISSNQKRRG